jgi:uncharacterized protein YqgV (UPF0045/DUF77 family)
MQLGGAEHARSPISHAGAARRSAPLHACPVPTEECAVLAEIQVSPRPAGTPENRYAHVDAAIAVIQSSGLTYEVHALGTVVEGPPDEVWALLRRVHEATLSAGAAATASVVKLSEGADDGGPSIADLVGKFRA